MRMEAGANLVGGQPFSLANLRETAAITHEFGLPLVLDASLLQDNLYLIKKREAACQDMSVREITRAIADCCDIIYFSARKFGFAKGGGITLRDNDLANILKELIVLNEGFLTYGGMSVREMAAITVGLEETMDMSIISQGPEFIAFMVDELVKRGIPVVTPAGGLGCHLNAKKFVPNIPGEEYPAGALASALFIAGGIRGMERGTMSETRNLTAARKSPPWSSCAWPYLAESSLSARSNTLLTASTGCGKTAPDRGIRFTRNPRSSVSSSVNWSPSPTGRKSLLSASVRISATPLI